MSELIPSPSTLVVVVETKQQHPQTSSDNTLHVNTRKPVSTLLPSHYPSLSRSKFTTITTTVGHTAVADVTTSTTTTSTTAKSRDEDVVVTKQQSCHATVPSPPSHHHHQQQSQPQQKQQTSRDNNDNHVLLSPEVAENFRRLESLLSSSSSTGNDASHDHVTDKQYHHQKCNMAKRLALETAFLVEQEIKHWQNGIRELEDLLLLQRRQQQQQQQPSQSFRNEPSPPNDNQNDNHLDHHHHQDYDCHRHIRRRLDVALPFPHPVVPVLPPPIENDGVCLAVPAAGAEAARLPDTIPKDDESDDDIDPQHHHHQHP